MIATVGTKNSEWNGSAGSITVPARSERPIRNDGLIERRIMNQRMTSIGVIMQAMARF